MTAEQGEGRPPAAHSRGRRDGAERGGAPPGEAAGRRRAHGEGRQAPGDPGGGDPGGGDPGGRDPGGGDPGGETEAGDAPRATVRAQAGQPAEPARLSYEQARDQLAEVVRQLESGGLTLEQSLELWERGERLAAICADWLEGARARLAAATPEHTGAEGGDTPF